MTVGQKIKISAGLAVASSALFSAASAQDSGGVISQFFIGQSIVASDNLDFDSAERSGLEAVTQLGVSYATETRASRFSFDADGSISAETDEAVDVVNPSVSFAYSTGSRNTSLEFSGSYLQDDVESLGYLSTLTDTGDLDLREVVLGTGTRSDVRLRFGVETGLSAPFGMSFRGTYTQRDYSNTTDPSLSDYEQASATVTARFDLNPTTRLQVALDGSRYDVDNAADTLRETTRLSSVVTTDIRPDLSASAFVDYQWNDVSGVVDTETEGFGFGGGLELARVNGTVSLDFSSEVETTGRQYLLSAGRAFDLQRGQAGFSIGVVKPDDEDWQPLYSANYLVETPRGGLEFRLFQSSSVNDLNQDLINTAATAKYTQDINSVSRWNTSLNFAQTDTLTSSSTAQRMDIGLEYRRELAQEWDVVVGYRHALSKPASGPDVDENSVSLSIQKTFDWRH